MKHQTLEYRFLETALAWAPDGKESTVWGYASDMGHWYLGLQKVNPVNALVFKHLFRKEVVRLRIEGESIQPYINLNDTFCYAGADLVFVEPSEFQTIFRIWSKYKYDGVIAYCAAMKYHKDPINQHITIRYLAARDEILSWFPMTAKIDNLRAKL